MEIDKTKAKNRCRSLLAMHLENDILRKYRKAGYIAITDRDWFEFHKYRKHKEVVFWRHADKPQSISEGTTFFFLVKKDEFAPKNEPRQIEGYGAVEETGSKALSELWEVYREKLGSDDLESLVESLSKGNYIAREDQLIGYYKLKDVVFLKVPVEPENTEEAGFKNYIDYFAEIPFKRNIMTGVTLDALQTAKLLEKIK